MENCNNRNGEKRNYFKYHMKYFFPGQGKRFARDARLHEMPGWDEIASWRIATTKMEKTFTTFLATVHGQDDEHTCCQNKPSFADVLSSGKYFKYHMKLLWWPLKHIMMTMVKMMSSCPVQSGGRLKEECNLCGRQLVRCHERLRAITLSLTIVVIIITSIITTIIIISTINNSMQKK